MKRPRPLKRLGRTRAARKAGQRKPRSPFAIGLITIIATAIITYLAVTKDIPLLNEPYEVKAAFRDASNMRKNSPVRIAGIEVGRVSRVEHENPGDRHTTVTLAILEKGRPIKKDARFKIRPRIFLEGNFYVDISPGTPSAPELEHGETVPVTQTSNPVQFDEVLSILQRDTRDSLSALLKDLGEAQRRGAGRLFNATLRHQSPAYKYSAIVAEALLGERPGSLGDFIRDQGTVSAALDADRAALQNLIVDFNTTARALAERDDELRAGLRELPEFLEESQPTFAELNDAFPSVRRFAAEARPGIRSLGPTARELVPLVRQLRGLVQPAELRGLSRDLREATPQLAGLTRETVSFLEQQRLLASCTSNVLVPFANQTVPDRAFPTGDEVFKNVKAFSGLAGESRSFDANNQWFKVLGGGGAETFNIGAGTGLFGTALSPITGVNPPPDRTRPPLEREVPCETQEIPDLSSNPANPPPSVPTNARSPRVRERTEKAREVALKLMQARLEAEGRKVDVADRDLTLQDVEEIAARNGLLDQLRRHRERNR